jgi:hypothetical protein
MNNERKQTSANEVEQMTPNEAQRLAIAIGQLEGMAPNKVLAEGWRLTRATLALEGMEIPHAIEFLVDGRRQIRATRVATLEDLARAIGALNEDIERLSRGPRRAVTVGDELESLRQWRALEPQDCATRPYLRWLKEEVERLSRRAPTDIIRFIDRDIEELRRDRASLLELQSRASQSGCATSTTVIEALFPHVPVKKKTPAEREEIERWLAIRKEEALKIDPETAEVDWSYEQTLDPYGVRDEWELPEEFDQVGRAYFARAPGNDIWVEFGDLPQETREKLWNRHRRKLAFTAGFEGLPQDGPEIPF